MIFVSSLFHFFSIWSVAANPTLLLLCIACAYLLFSVVCSSFWGYLFIFHGTVDGKNGSEWGGWKREHRENLLVCNGYAFRWWQKATSGKMLFLHYSLIIVGILTKSLKHSWRVLIVATSWLQVQVMLLILWQILPLFLSALSYCWINHV